MTRILALQKLKMSVRVFASTSHRSVIDLPGGSCYCPHNN